MSVQQWLWKVCRHRPLLRGETGESESSLHPQPDNDEDNDQPGRIKVEVDKKELDFVTKKDAMGKRHLVEAVKVEEAFRAADKKPAQSFH